MQWRINQSFIHGYKRTKRKKSDSHIFLSCRENKMDLTIIKKDWNPWEASSIFDFSYFCCPECDAKSQSKQDFVDHASNYHTWVSLKLIKRE
jgi:hypothetical protein